MASYYKKFQNLDQPSEENKSSIHLSYLDDQKPYDFGPIHTSFPCDQNPLRTAWVETFGNLEGTVKSDPVEGNAVGGFTVPNAINTDTGDEVMLGLHT
jgi:hypothetical protein